MSKLRHYKKRARHKLKFRYVIGIIIFEIFVFVIAWKNKTGADQIASFLIFAASLGGGDIVKTLYEKKMTDKRKRIYWIIAVVLIVDYMNVVVANTFKYSESIEEGTDTEAQNKEAEKDPLISIIPSVQLIDWSSDIYLLKYMKSTDQTTFDENNIAQTLMRYAQKYKNGEEILTGRKTKQQLETGPYGSAISDANKYREDRSKIESEKLINYSYIEELKSRKEANEISQEADNLKILGELYTDCYEKNLESEIEVDMADDKCLEESLKYLILALSIAYFENDRYDEAYLKEIWKEIVDGYIKISNIKSDEGLSDQAKLIASAIQHCILNN